MIELLYKKDCCGCGACVSTCKHNAIDWRVDEEGFSYPLFIEHLCKNCGLCDKVCPFANSDKSLISTSQVYAVKNKDVQVQLDSSSGGVFYLISKHLLTLGGGILGASYNDDWQVEHKLAFSENEVKSLMRSKYVQSDNRNSYLLVNKLLSSGKKVLFSGTPCQCLSLKRTVGKNNSNLYLVDVICHGVPSPMIWGKYLDEQSQKRGYTRKLITKVAFKYKDSNKYHWRHPGFIIEWNNQEEMKCWGNETSYENGFLSGLFVRPSCHNCKVKSLSSGSDLTIGDYWGCDSSHPEFYDKNGVSLLFVNTEKGRELFDAISNDLVILPLSIEEAIKYNKRITTSSVAHKNREKFFNNQRHSELDLLIPFLLRKSLKEKLYVLLRRIKNKINKLT